MKQRIHNWLYRSCSVQCFLFFNGCIGWGGRWRGLRAPYCASSLAMTASCFSNVRVSSTCICCGEWAVPWYRFSRTMHSWKAVSYPSSFASSSVREVDRETRAEHPSVINSAELYKWPSRTICAVMGKERSFVIASCRRSKNIHIVDNFKMEAHWSLESSDGNDLKFC